MYPETLGLQIRHQIPFYTHFFQYFSIHEIMSLGLDSSSVCGNHLLIVYCEELVKPIVNTLVHASNFKCLRFHDDQLVNWYLLLKNKVDN